MERSVGNQANGGSIADLPEFIVEDILSRLPANTIFSCRCVCKTWLNLLLDPQFAQLHLSRAPLEFLLTPSSRRPINLLLTPLDQPCNSDADTDVHVTRKSILNLKTHNTINYPSEKIEIYSSCHGLLFLRILKGSQESPNAFWDPQLIYNPITGEHLVLNDSFTPTSSELGFSRKTNEFKVLRFLFTPEMAEIQTLGTNLWRSIRDVPPKLSFFNSGPFLNGCHHWIISNSNKLIISFDFEEEKFQSLPPPSDFSGARWFSHSQMSLGSLGGCLCMSYFHCRNPGASLDIWVMNEYGIKESWTKQFVIDNRPAAFVYQPIKFMISGEILVLCNKRYLISYNPRTRKYRYVNFFGTKRKFAVFPHIPNFVRVLSQSEN